MAVPGNDPDRRRRETACGNCRGRLTDGRPVGSASARTVPFIRYGERRGHRRPAPYAMSVSVIAPSASRRTAARAPPKPQPASMLTEYGVSTTPRRSGS